MSAPKFSVGQIVYVAVPNQHMCSCGDHHEIAGHRPIPVVVEAVVKGQVTYGWSYWVHPERYDFTYSPLDRRLFHRWIREEAISETARPDIESRWSEPT